MLPTPRALLLDFGGVIADGPDHPSWQDVLVEASMWELRAGMADLAGLGAAVLMRSSRVERPPHPDGVAPDAAVAGPVELHALLAARW